MLSYALAVESLNEADSEISFYVDLSKDTAGVKRFADWLAHSSAKTGGQWAECLGYEKGERHLFVTAHRMSANMKEVPYNKYQVKLEDVWIQLSKGEEEDEYEVERQLSLSSNGPLQFSKTIRLK
mmetsp:Transcript_19371/g.45813  ORF Transcript_19371/g.45813 Transcript_19371/m.45813 type:complete len:125 (-) Transcript_19371:136-510(-)